MATTPTVNRLQLSSLLRYYREGAKLTQEEIGIRVFRKTASSDRVLQTRVAKIERGERQLHESELHDILDACGVVDPDVIALMDKLLENSNKRGRWSGYRAVYDESFRKWVDLEADAQRMRQVALEVVPDLCETESYIRALFGVQVEEGLLTGAEYQPAVRARLARQEILPANRSDGPPLELHLVMSESCLRRVVGNRAVMAEQLRHLVEMSQQPNVTIQIVPFSASVSGVVFAAYSMVRIPVLGALGDLDFVYRSAGNTPLYLDDKTAVHWHEQNFQAVSASALRPDDSRNFLREIEREYRL